MLDKLVVHLKNILFFKAIIYVLTIIILISVVAPILTNDLKQAVSRQEQSKLSLKQAKHKLASIADFEQNIASTNLHFNELVARPTNAGCFNRNDFVNRLKFLEKKYHLIPPLAINITRIFEEKTAKKHNNQVKINSYRAIITFQTNKENVLQITQDICTTLPAGAIITDIEIQKISVITPSFVKSLSTQSAPGLFQVTVGAHLREIVYEK